jgi:FHA domain
MEEVIWVEVLSRHRDITARHRCRGPVVTIGRGYDNDVVVDDPYVAPAHLRITRDASGSLVAEDLGTTNGLFVDRRRERLQRVRLDGDKLIRIGSTTLRVREGGQPVAPERPYRRNTRSWVAAGIMGVAIIAIDVLWIWLGETSEPKVTRYISPLFGVTLMTLVWIAGWSILTRIFAGEVRFERNVVAALAGLLVYSLYDEVANFAAFSLSSRAVASFSGMFVWILLAAATFAHLRIIGRSRLRLKAAAVTALALAVIGVQALSQSEARQTFGQADAMNQLMPPVLRLAPVRDWNSFAGEIEATRRRLDEDRKAEPSGPGGFFGAFFGVSDD